VGGHWWDLSAPLVGHDDLDSAKSRLDRKRESWNGGHGQLDGNRRRSRGIGAWGIW